MDNSITHVAMDTHKKEHAVAWVYPDTGEVEAFTVKNTVKDVTKMVKRIQRKAPGAVRFCYEAGVCGFTLQRRIEALGSSCAVIAPSLVPVKKGDRIKTDRRDARKLLGQFLAGELTEVYPPSVEQEAAREITRCRQAAQEDVQRARHQLLKFLTRHGYIYSDGRHWTGKHARWLLALQFDAPDLREVFDWYYTQLQHCQQRLATLDKEVAVLAARLEYRKIVGALRRLLGRLEAGDVLLADAMFSNYWTLAPLLGRGVDLVRRHDGKRKLDFRKGRWLGRYDPIVDWHRPKRPWWMSQRLYRRLPETLSIRQLKVGVRQKGFRCRHLHLVTTLLDAQLYRRADLATAFRSRWHAELDFRSIKHVVQMDVLRCKSLAMVRKEIWMHPLACNLIRKLMAQAAREAGLCPRDISFKGTLQTLVAFAAAGWACPNRRN